MKLTYGQFKQMLTDLWGPLPEPVLERIYSIATRKEVVYVTGNPGPTGKTRLVKTLTDMGVQTEEVYSYNLITITEEEIKCNQ